MNPDPDYQDWEEQLSVVRHDLVKAETRTRGEWQSKTEGNDPRYQVRESLNVQLGFIMPPTIDQLQELVKPNLPWAEDHFQERIGGLPMNPGAQYRNWPWYKQGVEEHKPDGKFSHTYMERFWPKHAGHKMKDLLKKPGFAPLPHRGIRFDYGDLQDVVELLKRRPGTRQAFLPVWFPEDTGAVHGERVPCTIGYHFQIVDDALFCAYFARSIDFVRYLRDDAYMAARLAEWVAYGVNPELKLGWLVMNIANLHCFEGDVFRLRRDIADEKDEIYGA